MNAYVLLSKHIFLYMVGAEGIEPSTSSASRKHSATELRACFFKPIYINDLGGECQYAVSFRIHLHFHGNDENVRQAESSARYSVCSVCSVCSVYSAKRTILPFLSIQSFESIWASRPFYITLSSSLSPHLSSSHISHPFTV
jgi:hypothetical protein